MLENFRSNVLNGASGAFDHCTLGIFVRFFVVKIALLWDT